jgi:hypothetical protein
MRKERVREWKSERKKERKREKREREKESGSQHTSTPLQEMFILEHPEAGISSSSRCGVWH